MYEIKTMNADRFFKKINREEKGLNRLLDMEK